MSGIVNNALTKQNNRTTNLLFLFGLILGPLFYMVFSQTTLPFIMTSSVPIIIIGGLLVGSTMAKSMAISNKKPFYPINHLEGHLLSPEFSIASFNTYANFLACSTLSST